MPHPTPHTLAAAKRELETLVRFLESCGVVATVTQEPCQPLAMGHHKTVVSVRAGRTNPHIFGTPPC